MQQLIEQLEKMVGAKFVSVTYTAKGSGETARYTFRMGVDYAQVCADDILELKLRLPNAKGIEFFVIQEQIKSLEESIKAKEEGREHVDYTKKGLYRSVCPGVKVNIDDGTFEIGGFQHSKHVIVPGFHKKVNHKSPETAFKAKLRKTLKTGKFRTLAIDKGQIHRVRLNGEELIFE